MRRHSNDLATRIVRTVREHHLFMPGDTVIIAFSGGADSTALLDLLGNLPEFPLRLVAAHLNHCLRGSESDGDEEFSRALASRNSIPFESLRIDVKLFAAQQGLNLEDAGRRARIAFLEDISLKWRAAAVALAHHADDQAETVLMRLLRGAGPCGLCGMPYRNDRGFVRPLLNITRSEIETYLAGQNLAYREDASNRDTTFLRNRIRHELLPLLEQYNPNIRERLGSTAALLAAEDTLLDQLSEKASERVCTEIKEGWACDIALLSAEPSALRRRVLRLILGRLTGNLDHFSFMHIVALERLIDSARPNASLNLPRGIMALRVYGTLRIQRASTTITSTFGEMIITGPGHYQLPDGGLFTVNLEPASSAITPLPPNIACFDPDKAPFPWTVRAFRNGDRMIPFGMNGSKKVKEIFIEAKIPLSQRRFIPMLFSGDTLIWVCGLRTSNLAKINGLSSRAVKVEFFNN